jgi:hypothetical protein
VALTPSAYFSAFPLTKFNIVILCTNEPTADSPADFLSNSAHSAEEALKHLEVPGVYVQQYWGYDIMPNLSQVFFPVYAYLSSPKTENTLFGLMHTKKYLNGTYSN